MEEIWDDLHVQKRTLHFKCKHSFLSLWAPDSLGSSDGIQFVENSCFILLNENMSFNNKSPQHFNHTIFNCIWRLRCNNLKHHQLLNQVLVAGAILANANWIYFLHQLFGDRFKWNLNQNKILYNDRWLTTEVQSSAVITRSNIVRYYINNYRNWDRISIRCWIHKRHPIVRPNGRAMECLLWIFVKEYDRVITAPHWIMQIGSVYLWGFILDASSVLKQVMQSTPECCIWGVLTSRTARKRCISIVHTVLAWDKIMFQFVVLRYKHGNLLQPTEMFHTAVYFFMGKVTVFPSVPRYFKRARYVQVWLYMYDYNRYVGTVEFGITFMATEIQLKLICTGCTPTFSRVE